MANPVRGQKRDQLFYVALSSGNIKYGFKTKDDPAGMSVSALQTQLGWHPVTTDAVVFGVNRPKPARFAKVLSTGRTFSGYAGDAFWGVARQNDWRLAQQPHILEQTAQVKSIVAVPLPAMKNSQISGVDPIMLYGWLMRKDDIAAYGSALTFLGIQLINTSAELARTVLGCNSPKPGRARKRAGAAPAGSFSSFYDISKLNDIRSDNNWSILSQALP